ncbi:MAG: hypothetical protein LQ352_001861 [Teloschistes flavicans]|nr:MAG: hypothetical protein LQ352_001861 [Teloschistes flavicans]
MGPATERSAVKVGDRVGIKWVAAICGSCPPCLEGHDAMCHKGKISGYYTYILLSFSLKNRNGDMLGARSAKDKMYKFIDANGIFLGIRPGTFQEYVVSQADYVTPIPEAIKSEDAAPMLCAGVTTYAALRRSQAKSGQWVVISGAGGGLVINLPPSVGVPEGDPVPMGNAFPAKLIFKGATIASTAVGTRKDAIEVLDFAARGVVNTVIRTEKLDKLTDVFQEMKEGKLNGRVVMDLQ